MFYETLKLAVQAIRRNALRSFLTLLGIVIGVAGAFVAGAVWAGRAAGSAASSSRVGLRRGFMG